MKYQTCPELGPYINAWGCHFCAVLEKVEKAGGYSRPWTFGDILIVYHDAMEAGFVQREVHDAAGNPKDGCDVIDGVKLFNLAAAFHAIPARLVEYAHVDAGYRCKPGEEEILRCARHGHAGYHFMDGNGQTVDPWQAEIEFDPIELHTVDRGLPTQHTLPGSWTQADGWIDEKRILRFA